MKSALIAGMLALMTTQACTSATVTRPAIEPGIYEAAAPFVDIKQSFYVRERERPLLADIAGASDAIVLFLIDMHNAGGSAPRIRQVEDGARGALRLPPSATRPAPGRYVDTALYCWESDHPGQLKVVIEWGDIVTKARYTDSYVFVRRGTSWYFARHGSYAPWHWTQTERYFQRACPAGAA